jgi:hypothetical protein
MNKDEFIEWLNSTSFEKAGSDSSYRDLMNYSEYIFDYLEVNENTVTFTWEEWYWGGRDNRTSEYSFEEFIERYNNYELK